MGESAQMSKTPSDSDSADIHTCVCAANGTENNDKTEKSASNYANVPEDVAALPKNVGKIGVIRMAVAFFFIFAAFSVAQNVQTSRSKSVGSFTLGILYGVFTIGNLFSSALVLKFGARRCLFYGAITYALFVAANIQHESWMLYTAAALIGWGASLLWNGMGVYITQCSAIHEYQYNLPRRSIRGYFNGIFFSIFSVNMIVGNLLVAFLFQSDVSEGVVFLVLTAMCVIGCLVLLTLRSFPESVQTLGQVEVLAATRAALILVNSDMIKADAHGANRERTRSGDDSSPSASTPASVAESHDNDHSFHGEEAVVEPRVITIRVHDGANADAHTHATEAAQQPDSAEAHTPQNEATHTLDPNALLARQATTVIAASSFPVPPSRVWKHVADTIMGVLKVCREMRMALILPLSMAHGISMVVSSGIYPTFVDSSSRKFYGLTVFGLFGVLGSIASGKLSDRFGRRPIITLATIINVVCITYLIADGHGVWYGSHRSEQLVNNAHHQGDAAFIIYLVIGGLLGIAYAIYQTEMHAMVSALFEDRSALAFSALKFASSFAITVAFFYNPYLGVYAKLLISSSLLVIGTGGLYLLMCLGADIDSNQRTRFATNPSEPDALSKLSAAHTSVAQDKTQSADVQLTTLSKTV